MDAFIVAIVVIAAAIVSIGAMLYVLGFLGSALTGAAIAVEQRVAHRSHHHHAHVTR